MSDETKPNIIELTADVVASYVSRNPIAVADLPALIKIIHGALSGQGETSESEGKPGVMAATKAEIRRSITPDALISFEDQKPYKMLRRHLTIRGLDPAAYRAKWGLPNDYPMTAISYSEERSRLARALGLGRKPAAATPPEPATAPPAAKATKAPAKPRKPKAAAPAAPELPPGAIDPKSETLT